VDAHIRGVTGKARLKTVSPVKLLDIALLDRHNKRNQEEHEDELPEVELKNVTY